MRKPSSSLPNLVLLLGSMLLIIQIERTSCQMIDCAALTFGTPFRCVSFGENDPCFSKCSPLNCTAFQAGARCDCLNAMKAPNNVCQRSGDLCGCTVDCKRFDPDALCVGGGVSTSCPLVSAVCVVDCRARGGCVPPLRSIKSFLYRDDVCSLADGGVCRNPPPTKTTRAPTTTTTEAPSTTFVVVATTAPTSSTLTSSTTVSAATTTTVSPVLTTVFIPPTIPAAIKLFGAPIVNSAFPNVTSSCSSSVIVPFNTTEGTMIAKGTKCVTFPKTSLAVAEPAAPRRRKREAVSLPFFGSPCTPAEPTKKYAFDLSKSTFLSTLFYDCARDAIFQCANSAVFDEPLQQCTGVVFITTPRITTTTPSTAITTVYFNQGPQLAFQSDYVNSLYKCNNVSVPKQSSTKYSADFSKCNKLYWFRKPDGSCNNLIYVWWGAADTPYKRLAKPAYEDEKDKPRKFSSIGHPLKNPRLIATTIHCPQDEYKAISHFLPIFGQFVMHDMAKTGDTFESTNRGSSTEHTESVQIKKCPCTSKSQSCINIDIPKGDPISPDAFTESDQKCLVQIRKRDSRSDFDCDLGHREQINEATSWLDLSNTYGNDERQQRKLRLFQNGRLKSSYSRDDQLRKYAFMPSKCDAKRDFKLLVKADVCFRSGDQRANENPLLAGVHTLFLREHNRIVDSLSVINPRWDDERLYQEGRRILTALYQHIVYAEWLPSVLGEQFHKSFGLAPQSQGYLSNYDPYVMPNVAIEFSAAAGRFGHALVRSLLSQVNQKFKITGNLNMSDSFFRPDLLINNGDAGFSDLMRGCLRDLGNNNQPHITEDLSDYLVVDHGNLNPTNYHSLPAININRGREVGLQPYNQYRPLAGLNKARTFDELTLISQENIERLKEVYDSVDDIDLFTGAMSEMKVPGGLVGPTFAYIIARGFRDRKNGDRFFYENSALISPYAFTPAQLDSIRTVRFSSILCNSLDLKKAPVNAFVMEDRLKNPFVLCDLTPQVNLQAFKDLSYLAYQNAKPLSSQKAAPVEKEAQSPTLGERIRGAFSRLWSS